VIGARPTQLLLDMFIFCGGLRAKNIISSAFNGPRTNTYETEGIIRNRKKEATSTKFSVKYSPSLVNPKKEPKSGTGINPTFSFHEVTDQPSFTGQYSQATNSSVMS
jgi:hypothetical protein